MQEPTSEPGTITGQVESIYGSFDPIDTFVESLQISLKKEYDNKIDGLRIVGFRRGKMGYSWILLIREKSPQYCVHLSGTPSRKRFEDNRIDEIQFHTLEEVLSEEYATF
jgi:hypothetical protein